MVLEMDKISFAEAIKDRNEQTPVEIPAVVADGKISLKIPDLMVRQNLKAWEHSLVGRFTRGRPNLDVIRRWASNTWKPKGNLEIAALPQGCILFNFNRYDDMLPALIKAPWFVNGKGLTMEKWHVGFDPKEMTARRVPLWVQIPGLPLHFWDKDIIRGIANSFGQILAIDSATAHRTRFIYARFCVLVNTELQIPESVDLSFNGRTWNMKLVPELERIKCQKCKEWGHMQASCMGEKAEVKEKEAVKESGGETQEEQEVERKEELGRREKEEEMSAGLVDSKDSKGLAAEAGEGQDTEKEESSEAGEGMRQRGTGIDSQVEQIERIEGDSESEGEEDKDASEAKRITRSSRKGPELGG